MPWMPDIPHDPGSQPQGSLTPLGVVAHRTYGSWNGDYSVGSGGKPPVGFHFLVGKDEGRWVQFYDTFVRCAHAGVNAGGNDISIAIELEGTNEQPLTDWQVAATRRIVDWLAETHGISKTYRFSTSHNLRADHGFIPHSAVAGSDHSDYWTVADWDRIVAEEPLPLLEDDMGVITIRDGEPGAGWAMFLSSGKYFDINGYPDRAALAAAFGEAEVSRAMWDKLVHGIEKG